MIRGIIRLIAGSFWGASLLLLVAPCETWAEDATKKDAAAPESNGPEYNSKVAPIFTKYCTGCHNAKDREGELVLESYDTLLKGGDNGPVIVPGKSGESLLVRVLTGKVEPQMPPEDNEKPKAEEIAILEAWINAGAKGPTSAALDPTAIVVPKIKLTSPVRNLVGAVAYSPDGKLIALGRYGSVDLLSTVDGKAVRQLAGHHGQVTSIGFSADGTLLVVGGGEPALMGEAKIWNVADGTLVHTFTGHKDNLYSAVLSRDSKWLATSSYDQEIKLWDITSGKELRTCVGHNDAVFEVAWRPDGKVLASASGDRTVKLWDVASGERLDTLAQPLQEVYCVAFSPDGTRVAAAGVDSRIRIWQISSDAKENTNPLLLSRFAHEGAVLKLAYSPDGLTLVSAGEDRGIRIWDANTLVERSMLEQQPDWVSAIAVSPDNHALLVGRLDGSFATYDLTTGKRLPGNQEVKTGQASGRARKGWFTNFGALRHQFGSAISKSMLVRPVLTSVAGLLVSQVAAATPPPDPTKTVVTEMSMHGMQRGIATRIVVSGKNLAKIKNVASNNPQLIVSLLPGGNDTRFEVEFQCPGNLKRGPYELAFSGEGDLSIKQPFLVDDLLQQNEREPNDSHPNANVLQLPTSVWGKMGEKSDLDHFAFEGRAGQTIVVDVMAKQISSKAMISIEMFDPKGQLLDTRHDSAGPDLSQDPLAAYTLPADGRYVVQLAGMVDFGPDVYYRVSIGPLAIVTGVFPYSVAPNRETDVRLLGFNLPANSNVKIAAKAQGEAEVDTDAWRSHRTFKVTVGSESEAIEAEPNDEPSQATPLAAPASVNGIISSRSSSATPTGEQAKTARADRDLFRFESHAGETWMIETEASRRGSPADTVVEVLTADGRPIERVLLAAVRDSFINYKDLDPRGNGVRFANPDEMKLTQYVYMSGEVCRLFHRPDGPDADWFLYGVGTFLRRSYFDTTATSHALNDPAYIVEPHEPGSKLSSSGLPVFPVYYQNDDDSMREWGSDSRLTFKAPANGAYLVRVRDAREIDGPLFAYRLSVRRAEPSFAIRLNDFNHKIPAGSGRRFILTLDRLDGFDDDVSIDIAGLPTGFTVSAPLVVAAGHREANGVIFAAADAPDPTSYNASQSIITATAVINGQKVTKPVGSFGKLELVPKPKLLAKLEPSELTIVPGGRISAMIKIERNGVDDSVVFSVENLPHGVYVDDVGLNGVMVLKGQSERQIFLVCEDWVVDVSRPFFVEDQDAGKQASAPAMIHVRKSGAVTASPSQTASNQGTDSATTSKND